MLRRLVALFNRYAAVHLRAEAPGFALREPNGRLIGEVDSVAISDNRLRLAGWARAMRLELRLGDAETSVRPHILREDIAARLGIDPRVGFELDIPLAAGAPRGEASLGLIPDGPSGAAPVSVTVRLAPLARSRRALWPVFLYRVAQASPSVLRWRMAGDQREREKVKRILALDAVRQAGILVPAQVGQPPEPPPQGAPVTLVMPVYNAFEVLTEALERVARHTDLPWRMILVEDASPDPRVRPFLRDWAATQDERPDGGPRVEVLENEANLGFIGSVNRAFARAIEIGQDVVLLNSDALVPEGWASRLLAPLRADPTVATVTPFSNDAEIVTAPVICERAALAPGQADAIDLTARALDPLRATAPMPTGVGFCMAIAVAVLRRLPEFDPVFAPGYGEEVDWCQRARALGGRHLGTAALFVEHRGGASFGSEAKRKLIARNGALISRRYPSFDREVQDFIGADRLLTARLLLGLAWAGAWSDGASARAGDDAAMVPIYLAHVMGGGADFYLDQRIRADLAVDGRPSVVIRVGGAQRWLVELVTPQGVTAGGTDNRALVRKLLAPLRRRRVVYSCAVGDPDPVALPPFLLSLAREAAASRVEVLLHDYFPVSPSYTLLDSALRFQGPVRPDLPIGADPAHRTTRLDGAPVDLAAWQAAWRPLIARADEVTAFCRSSGDLLLAAYPEAESRLRVRPHRALAEIPPCEPPADGPRVLGILGNIGVQKGAALVRDLADLVPAARPQGRGIARLVLIGNIDSGFAARSTLTVHGAYRLSDLPALVARYGITEWLIPSIWPETFSYTTQEALATGLPVYAFDIGGQGEAVARAPNGRPLPFRAGETTARQLLDYILAERVVEAIRPVGSAATA